MLSHKNVTLLGSNAVFLGVLGALFWFPARAVVLFPVSATVFFWNDLRREEELQGIFLFMAVIAGLILISRASDVAVRAALGIEIFGVLLIGSGLGLHHGRLLRQRQRAMGRARELEAAVQDLERDLKFYSSFEQTASAQIALRRDLTESAKSLGSTLDPQEVQMRLVRIVEKRYPQSRVRILPGQPADPLVARVVETRSSLLVRDAAQDERLTRVPATGFRSVMVAPLLVLKRPFGFLRVEDDRPGAFQLEDLRTVELFSTLAALALENVQLFQSVNDLATHDPLTQLYTHRAFHARLEEEVLRAGRSQQPVSVVMADVDHFKRYNDTYGHPAGDFLLKTVAGILTHHARPVDFVARYGGEEFTIILPGVDHVQAVAFADQVRTRIAQEAFVFQGQRTGVTLSFGVASFPQDSATPSQILRAADERLYKAKHGGRNRVVG